MTAQTILPANTLSSGYDVANSLRFNTASTDYLNRTAVTGTSRRKFTISVWVKIQNGGDINHFSSFEDGNNRFFFWVATGIVRVLNTTGGTDNLDLRTNRVLRDSSAWYHLVLQIDSTHGNASFRARLYINGVQETSFATASYPSQNADLEVGTSSHTIDIGRYGGGGDEFNGYMCEYVHLDGLDHAASFFGEFDDDSGIWKPKDVSDFTFGNNGFYLEFKQSGTSQNSSGLGADTSGEDHHFAVNNLTAIDQTTDTCTNNFATLNPNNGTGSRTQNDTYSEGNTIMIPANHDNYTTTFATMGAKNGKWYWEAQSIVEGTASNAYYPRTIGIMTDNNPLTASTLGQDQFSWDVVYNSGNWDASHNNSVVVDNMSTDRTSGNILQFALDLDNGKFYFGIGGSYLNSGDPTTGSTGTGAIHTLSAADLGNFIIPAVTNATTGTYYKFNFGNPAFSISSGNADANGHGNFEYAPPSGYFAWCSKNLAEFG